MSDRTVHKDKIGLYISDKKRKFRPQGPTVCEKGTKTYSYQVYKAPEDELHVREGTTKNPDGTWKTRSELWAETWKTTDPVPEPEIKNVDKGAQVNIRRKIGRASIRVIVGENGFDYGQYKRDARPGSYLCTDGKDLMISMNNSCLMTWEEWDDLVQDIEHYRTEVPLRKIRDQVEEHNELMKQMKEIRERYEPEA
jgi:hypothetical protein